jgi:hypothetical protein
MDTRGRILNLQPRLDGTPCTPDMHTKDARAHGETEQRLYAVVVWREALFFRERERASLAWTGARSSRSLSAGCATGRSQDDLKCSH